jgi:hypothetical protein
MDGKLIDGALIDAFVSRLDVRIRTLLVAIGVDNVALQGLLMVGVLAGILWLAWRASRLGYRVNVAFGMAVEVITVGAAFVLLAITVPAWLSWRQPVTALLAQLSQ